MHPVDAIVMHPPGEEWRRRTDHREHDLDDVDAEEDESCCRGCGTVAAAEHGVTVAWRRRRRIRDDTHGGSDTRGARVRRRTGRSVAVLFLFLVLAVLGCSSAWPTPSWPSPSAVARFVASAVHRHTRTTRSAAPVVAHGGRAGWNPWSWNTGWNADAILDKLQRVGSSLLGTRPSNPDNGAAGKGE